MYERVISSPGWRVLMEWILIRCRGAFQECWALGRQEWLIRAVVRKIAPASSLEDEEVEEEEEEEGPKG